MRQVSLNCGRHSWQGVWLEREDDLHGYLSFSAGFGTADALKGETEACRKSAPLAYTPGLLMLLQLYIRCVV